MKVFVLGLFLTLGSFSIGRYISADEASGPATLSIRPESCSAESTQLSVVENKTLVPVKSSKFATPCSSKTSAILVESFRRYSDKVISEVELISEQVKEEMKKELSPEELEDLQKSRENRERLFETYRKRYPRFPLSDSPKDDFLYYGIHAGEFKDVKRFLGERACYNPLLSFVNQDTSYLGLFFTISNGRSFQGVLRIINEKFITPIEGSLSFSEIDDYFEKKIIPPAHFLAWAHEDVETNHDAYFYQSQDILSYHSIFNTWFDSPWLYNGCNKSVGVINNYCSIDSSMDMEFKEFFYLTDHDLMLGNIYCKKSSDLSWKRIATMELIRTK